MSEETLSDKIKIANMGIFNKDVVTHYRALKVEDVREAVKKLIFNIHESVLTTPDTYLVINKIKEIFGKELYE